MNEGGSPVILAGSNYWYAIQDGGTSNPPSAFDFNTFVSFLVSHGLNYTKAHVWEQCIHDSPSTWYIQPTIYARSGTAGGPDGGNKFDLTSFNSDYFDRLRSRCITYGNNGIYVAINIFNHFSVWDGNTMSNVWNGHPFNSGNNVNSVNGDPTSTGAGEDIQTLVISSITSLQETYVDHLIDTLNDLDNIIWEVGLELSGTYSRGGSTAFDFMNYFVDYVHTYESGKAKQHIVLCSSFYPSPNDSWMITSNNGDMVDQAGINNSNGTKVLMTDMDHIDWTSTDPFWPWYALSAGHSAFAIMDGGYSTYDDQGGGVTYASAESLRNNAGAMLALAIQMDLLGMKPQSSEVSSGYGLVPIDTSHHDYFVFQNASGNITLDLSGEGGAVTFSIRKVNVADGSINTSQTVLGGASRTITQPSGWTSGWAAWVRVA